RGFIPWFLLVFGLGSVIGTGLGGRLADWNVLRSVAAMLVSLALVLSLFFFGSQYVMSALLLVFLAATATSALAITLQVRLMESAGEAAMLGAALNHSSLNIANGLGAYLGAVVISAGYGYRAPSAVGVVLALTGLVILAISIRAKRAHASR
ncbi:MAG: MFS transporter, partial [Propionibacteriales bacterium]|nr:MFS transporter [Propionibacteriales bacterium]